LQTLTSLTKFSIPIGATFVSANFAAHVCALLYAKMTLPAFAALTLIVPWNMLAGQISMQWTQATGIIVAQLLGNQTKDTVLVSFLTTAWRYAFVAAGIVATIFLVMCFSVDEIYPRLEAETRAIIFGFLPLLILIQPLRATNAICGNVLRASGDTVYVMYIFIWSQWAFRVPLTALFILYWDLSAFWVLSLWLAEEVVKFPVFHKRLLQGHWKHALVE
jgi:Na+-driven multidrug efflux pump